MPELNDSFPSSIRGCEDVAQRLSREAYVLGAGTIGGAAKDAINHPLETLGETAAMGVAAVGLTAVAAAELPVISVVAAGVGAVYAAGYAWNLIDPNSEHNIERNSALKSAVSTAWATSNRATLENSIQDLQDKSGRDTLQVFEALVAGGAAAKYGARTGDVIRNMPSDMLPAFALDGVAPRWFKSGADATAPTWDEYVNFSRGNHGPVIKTTMHQFEVKQQIEAARQAKAAAENAGENVTQPGNDVAGAKGAGGGEKVSAEAQTNASPTAQEAERSQSGVDTGIKSSPRPEPEDTSNRGNSLYFSHRFGSYHK